MTDSMRTTWTREKISAIYDGPLMDIAFDSQQIHCQFHSPNEIQMCRVLSIKTAGCPEGCAYCPPSAHQYSGVGRERLLAENDEGAGT